MEKIIFHIDVNSAFLSWSATEKLKSNPAYDLRNIPSIIGGDRTKRHGVVLAKSIPAKYYGIQTGEPIVNALKKCPALIIEPPNHALYEECSNQLITLLSSFCPDLEKLSIDECFMDFTPIKARYDSPIAAADCIKNTVRKKLGFTVNIGISNTKILAKMASDFQKPDLIHTLFKDELADKYWPLPVNELYMCGKSSVEILHNLGILTIGDLANTDLSILSAHLKSHGRLLWEYANGLDNTEISSDSVKYKGIGNSTTLSKDAETPEDAKRALLNLAETVSRRLRADMQMASTIALEIKYNTFTGVSHQTQLPSPVNTCAAIYTASCKLFDELWDGTPIRLLGIRGTKLLPENEPVQMNLFDMMNQNSNAKQQQLDKAIDSIRHKYGDNAVVRGSFLKNTDEFKKH